MDFCTYFDSVYAAKGWVCHKTLIDQSPSSRLFVLALDDKIRAHAEKLSHLGVIPVLMSDIEAYCPALLSVKGSRQPKEYYATVSPILPLFLFDRFGMDKVFYTDADMAFWSKPKEIETVMGDHSLMVVDHGFEPPRAGVRFNVGILGYRNDANCREFLEWWRDRCLEWCEWRTMPDGRCADQGWLNILHDQPERFKNVLSCPHTGINFAPWNVGKHIVTERNGKKIIDDKFNLICYHYHEFRTTGADSYYPTGWKLAQGDPVPVLKLIYEPYFVLIRKAMDGVLWGNQ
jgi:hypothetical protein